MINLNQKQCKDCEYWNENLQKEIRLRNDRKVRMCETEKMLVNEFNYCGVRKFVPKGAFN